MTTPLSWRTPVRIVGRRDAIARLITALGRGRTPVLVEGDVGVGRTQLLHAFGEAARVSFGWEPRRIRLPSHASPGAVATMLDRAFTGPRAPETTLGPRNERLARFEVGPRALVLAVLDDGPPLATDHPTIAALLRLAVQGHALFVCGGSFPRHLAREVLTLTGLSEADATAHFVAHCGEAVPPRPVIARACRVLSGHPARLRLLARLVARDSAFDLTGAIDAVQAHGPLALVDALVSARPELSTTLVRWSRWAASCPTALALALARDGGAPRASRDGIVGRVDQGSARVRELLDAGVAWGDPFAFAPALGMSADVAAVVAAGGSAVRDDTARTAIDGFLVPALEALEDTSQSRDLLLAAWSGLEGLDDGIVDPELVAAVAMRLAQAALTIGFGTEALAALERLASGPHPPTGGDALAVELLRARGRLWRRDARGALDVAAAIGGGAAALGRAPALERARERLVIDCGEVLVATGELELAERAYGIGAASEEPAMRREASLGLARVHAMRGALGPAQRALEGALVALAAEESERSGSGADVAPDLLAELMDLALKAGDAWEQRARQAFELALRRPAGRASLAVALAVADRLVAQGLDAEAEGALAQIADVWRDTAGALQTVELMRATAALRRDDVTVARTSLAHANALLTRAPDAPLACELLWRQVGLALREGAWDTAFELADRGLRARLALGQDDQVGADIDDVTSALLAAPHGASAAVGWLAAVVRSGTELGSAEIDVEASRQGCRAALAAGDLAAARRFLGRFEALLDLHGGEANARAWAEDVRARVSGEP